MKKLKLDLDQVQVVSFAVESAEGKGTVNAFSGTSPYESVQLACGGSGESCDSCFPNYCPRMPASRDAC